MRGNPAPIENVLLQHHLLTDIVAIDCEMVCVGRNGHIPKPGRISMVNYDGVTVLDVYVRPDDPVTRFTPRINGITERHMLAAVEHEAIQRDLYDVLQDRTVVGHSLNCDFVAIFGRQRRSQPPNMKVVDIGDCLHLRGLINIELPDGRLKRPSLLELSSRLLGREIQGGVHSSVEDALAAMDIYKKYEPEIALESTMSIRYGRS